MHPDTLLITLAAEVSAANLLLGFFLLWGLSGGDDVARNPVAPVLGLATAAGTVGAFVTTLGLLQQPWPAVLAAAVVVVAGGSMWWLSTHEDDRARRQLRRMAIAAAVAVPVLFAFVARADAPTRTTLLWAAAPLIAAVASLGVAPAGWRGSAEAGSRWDWLVALGALAAVPALQGVALLLR